MSGAEPPVGAPSRPSTPVPPLAQQQQQESIELRNWLMLVATLTAAITYSAALNPPGGFWQADDAAKGYTPGRPVLYDTLKRQYNAFYYSNFTSFLTSLAIIILSSTPSFYNSIHKRLLSQLVALDIIGLATAFIAGSWTSPYQSIYGAVLLLIGVSCLVCLKFWEARRDLDVSQSVSVATHT